MGEDQRNLFIALGLIVVIMLGYDVFFMGPQREAREAEQAALEAAGELADPDLPVETGEPAAPSYVDRDDALTENSRIAIRNIRRDAIADIRELVKEKEASEDDARRGEDRAQEYTDRRSAEVEKALAVKESELMEI